MYIKLLSLVFFSIYICIYLSGLNTLHVYPLVKDSYYRSSPELRRVLRLRPFN